MVPVEYTLTLVSHALPTRRSILCFRFIYSANKTKPSPMGQFSYNVAVETFSMTSLSNCFSKPNEPHGQSTAPIKTFV